MYSIVDIETTGGKIGFDKITEIGIVLYDGNRIVKTFETLINPDRHIPSNVTKVTGITNEMVRNAPKFYQVAQEIMDLTNDSLFVGHNVHFDYKFIREEFREMGFFYHKELLCTLRLSRIVFPNLVSYKLGNLIQYFNIPVKERHRALADARATTTLLEKILENDKSHPQTEIKFAIQQLRIPKHFTENLIQSLPEDCGVYYFLDKEGSIIYIGKSLNIKNKFLEHFNANKEKSKLFQSQVHSIEYKLTGSDLIAQIVEYIEINKYHPPYNRIRTKSPKEIVITVNKYEEENVFLLDVEALPKMEEGNTVIAYFTNERTAESELSIMCNMYNLCKCSLLKPSKEYCSHRENEQSCPKNKIHNTQFHQEMITKIMDHWEEDHPGNKLIYDRGRTKDEYSFLLCEDNKIKGYGFISKLAIGNIKMIREATIPLKENSEIRNIYRNYIGKHKHELKCFSIIDSFRE